MKWYSIKKFNIHENAGICFIRNAFNQLFVSIPRYEKDGEEISWRIIDEDNIDRGFYCSITHFCIPDPIEIDE